MHMLALDSRAVQKRSRSDINVLFYYSRREEHAALDYAEIAKRINSSGAGIRALAIPASRAIPNLRAALNAGWRQTISIEMHRPRSFQPLGAKRLQHWRTVNKIGELERLDRAGIPVPMWTEIKPDTVIDPDEWGPYVVVKPAVGMKGAFVWVHKAGRVRYRAPSEYPPNHLGREGPMLAQKFVYTGPWPSAYRVATFLGRAVAAIRYDGRRDIPPLATEYGFRENGGRSIVAAAHGCKITCISDADVIELAERTHRMAFPEVPSLGVDIVRHEPTGALYVMECNVRGMGFILHSSSGRRMSREFGLNFHTQFDAIEVMTRATLDYVKAFRIGNQRTSA